MLIFLIIGTTGNAQQCFDCKSTISINNGLVLCLPFNGNANDESGNNNNGLVNNAVLTVDRNGKPNSAYMFNGNGKIVFSGTNFKLDNYTYSLWVKVVANPLNGNAMGILSIGNDGGPLGDQNILLSNNYSGGQTGFNAVSYTDPVQFPVAPDRAFTGTLPQLNTWYHLAAIRDNSSDKLSLYINGVKVKEENLSSINAGYATPIVGVIGARTAGNSQYFNGVIDDIRVYNRILAQSELLLLYNQKSKSQVYVNKDTTILVGDSAKLWVTGGSSFNWYPSAGLSNANLADPKAAPTVNTSYKVAVDGVLGNCSDTQTVNITVAQPSCETCNSPASINTGLELCFPFNGNANDESGNNNNGSVSNAVLTVDRNGKPNSAYLFNGINSYIELANNLKDMTVTTLCAWIKPQGNSSLQGMIFCEGNSICGNDFGLLYTNGKIGVRADKSGAIIQSWAASSADNADLPLGFLNNWTFVTWVMKPDSSDIYMNGTLVKRIKKSGSNVGYHYLPNIGAFFDSGTPPCGSPRSTYFNGAIDDIRLYSRALSLDEIAQLYALEEPLKINTINDVQINIGDSIGIWATANGNATFSWQPAVGLSNPNIANPKASPPQTTTYVVTVKIGSCEKNDTVIVYVNENKNCTYVNLLNKPNLVQNGDFEAGNTGFNTPLSPFVSPPLDAGQYIVVNDASTVHFAYKQKDHTSGSGNFMVIKAPNVATDVWCQTVPVKTNTYYRFAVWLNSVVNHVNYPGTPNAKVELHINGQKISKNVTITDLPDEWILLDTLWFSGSATTANLCVHDIATDGNGNDFGLDDISFKECECTIAVDAGLDVAGCVGDSVQLSATSDLGTLSWFPTEGLSDSTTLTPKLKLKQNAIYYLKVQSGNCVAKDSINITINPLPVLNVGADTVKCVSDTLLLNASSSAQIKLKWFPSSGLDNDTISRPKCFINQNTVYTIIATDTVSGCKSSDSLYVTVSQPKAAFTPSVISGSKPLIVLFNNSSTPQTAKFLWDFGDTSLTSTDKTPEYTYNKKGLFKVLLTVTDSNGCIDTVSSGIEVFEQVKIFIPNVFSPNGDNINDAFMAVYEAALIKQVKGSIWNRWGGLVYEFELPNGKWWDGTSSGKVCTDGVYVYIFEFTGIDNRIYKFNGLVTLLR